MNPTLNASGHEVEQRLFLILLQLSVIILGGASVCGVVSTFQAADAAGWVLLASVTAVVRANFELIRSLIRQRGKAAI